ncbi:MAG: hypothetical protein QF416_01400, partial [Candidatus Marinimicrobia bacterium]|nr:hypothetical protein [Candidatus Neomarinimicrobiota bacterium]
MTFSGGGTFTNADKLVLNDAGGVLEFAGQSATTVSHVKLNSGDTTDAPTLKMSSNGVIKNLTHTEFSEINFANGKTLTIEQAFDLPAGKQMKIAGAAGTLTLGDNMTLAGTLNLSAANANISGSTVTLNGGTVQVDADINFSSDLVHQSNSSIVVADGKKLNYSGSEFNVGALMLTLSGAGDFVNTNNLTLNDPASYLKLNGIAKVSKVSVSADITTGKLEIAQDSIIETLSHSGSSRIDIADTKTLTLNNAFEIPAGKSMELLGTGGGTLSLADKLTLSGKLKVKAADTIKDGTLSLKGGTLEVSQDASIASTLLHEANSEVNVASGKVLTYSGVALDIGAFALTLSGGGKFANSTDLKFNNAASVLNLNGINEVSKVSFPVSLQAGALNIVQDATIQSLSHSGESRINISSAKTLTVTDDFNVPSNKSMVLNGAGGSLKIGNKLTLTGTISMKEQSILEGGTLAFDGGIVSVEKDSTISSAISHPASSTFEIASGKRLTMQTDFEVPAERQMNLTGSNGNGVLELQKTLTLSGTMEFAVPQTLDNGTLKLNGGTLSVKSDVTTSSAIALSVDSNVTIASGSTLTHSGGALNIGAKTLTFSGGGTFTNADKLVLNNAGGVLEFAGDTATTVSHVKINSGDTTNAPTLKMSSNGIIQNLTHEEFSEINFANGKTLTIEQAFDLPAGKQMKIAGAAGTLTLGDNMTLAGTLNLPVANANISGSTVTLNGGTVQVDADINFSSNLAQQANSSIVVADGKKLNYSGSEFNVGAQMLTLSGTGNFVNTNNLTLNDPASYLKLNGITKVSKVSISADNTTGKLEIAQDSIIETLSHSGSSRIDIANTKTLTLNNAFEIPAGKSMKLLGTGGGILSLAGKLTLSGTLKVQAAYTIKDGTIELGEASLLDADYNTSIASKILISGNTTLDIASGVILIYTGELIDLLNFQLKMLGSGTFSNTNSILLSDSDSMLMIAGDVTIDLIKVAANSSDGKGLLVKSTGAK